MKNRFKNQLAGNTHYIFHLLLQNIEDIKKDHGALRNSAGCVTYLYNYSRIFEVDRARQTADEILEIVLSNCHVYSEEIQSTLSFCSGITGTGWLITYLSKTDFIDFDTDDLSDLDSIAFAFFNRSLGVGNYDFLHGACGALYYLLSRELNERRKLLIVSMLTSLLDMACQHNGLLFWEFFDFDSAKNKKDILNLGLSHGTPSVLAVLAKAYQLCCDFSFLKDAITRCAYTIVQFKNQTSKASIYPYSSDINAKEDANSRLGWCYGDLGVAISLWHAARVLKDDVLLNEAVSTFYSASLRRGLMENQVRDAAVCHGSSGISHIFYKYYLETKEKSLLTASEYWMNATFELIKPSENNITGKVRWHNDHGYLNSFSLLDGLSGVGLCMLSQMAQQNLYWDDGLLM